MQMAVYNVDFRKIVVLAFLVVTFYWLMMPSQETDDPIVSDPTIAPSVVPKDVVDQFSLKQSQQDEQVRDRII